MRDINKLSNNVMARQLFLTLATTVHPPPATAANATRAIERWLARNKLRFPELPLDRILAMVADTLLPEAFEVEGVFTGSLVAVGFAISLMLAAV